MFAAYCAGMAINTTGTAAAHAIQSPMAAIGHTPHGFGVGALLPYVMRFNRPAIEEPVAALAAYMGLPPHFDAYMKAMLDLSGRIGIPTKITDIGVDRSDFRRLAVMALPDFNAGCNPRPLDVDGLVSILEAAS
jgi:alcohol dehydrogenase class IV